MALIIGGIGACGQAYLLHHELVDCLPYKVVDYVFYCHIANVGVCFSPLLAIICGGLFGIKRFWLAAILPVICCPLLFAVIFKIYSVVYQESNALVGFDGKTSATLFQDFFLYTVSLAITGSIIGAICSFILSRILKEKRFV